MKCNCLKILEFEIVKKFIFVIILLLLISCYGFSKQRPNILWINCDDLGQELGCYGNKDVYTPNIDKLASEGVIYLNAYANAPVCSPSRSSLITGVYPNSINCLNHRTINRQELPEPVVPVMELFRKHGYFCTNGSGTNFKKPGKEDFNFIGENFFDGTDWQERPSGQPFFAQIQIHQPHRDFQKDPERPVNPANVKLPDCYPNHSLLKADWALYLESIQNADKIVGKILDRLEKEGLADNTIVIFFGDNGRPHLRDKQWLYEGGLKIPLIIRNPFSQKKGEINDDLISLVDVTAGSLALAGIHIPEWMDGKNVFGGEKRKYIFGFRQRCGDAPDNIRSISDGRFKLIWNREPFRPYMQLSSYKKLQYPAFSLYKVLYERGELTAPFNQFMADSRPSIELYDLKNDPNEFVNLAGKKKYEKIQRKLFGVMNALINETEKNMIIESQETIEIAKKSSREYFKKGMKRRGLSSDLCDEGLLKYWESVLLN